MTVRPYARAVAIASTLLLTLVARPAQAQTLTSINWLEVDVVHVKVTATWAGGVTISPSTEFGVSAIAGFSVTDRFEIEFDYLMKDFKLRGQPTFRNFTASAPVKDESFGCPGGRVSGPIETAVVSLAMELDGMIMNVKLKRDIPFLGREALEEQKKQRLPRLFAGFTVDDPAAVLLGRETIFRNGERVGWLSSAGYGYTLGKFIGYGYVRDPKNGVDSDHVLSGSYELEVATERVRASVFLEPPYDPGMARIKS